MTDNEMKKFEDDVLKDSGELPKIEIYKIEIVKIDMLKIDGKNPNKMSKEKREALKKNIQRYGFLVPIITNKDLLIADGQTRWEIAKELGMTEVSIIRLNVSEVDRRMLRQVLNKLKGEHDVRLDIEEYSEILKDVDIGEFADLVGLERKYIEDVLESRKEFPEEYLELQQMRDTTPTDSMSIIKFTLTEQQKEQIQKKLKEDGKQMFQIIDYFVLVGK